MAKMTGLQIQKLLPKTNCKECGSNTCLAFAMKVAAKKAELTECPYVSEEAKEILGAAAEPPIRTVIIGPEEKPCPCGGETVLFRHEKTFINQTGLGVALSDAMDDEVLESRAREVAGYVLDRVGEELRLDLLSVAFESGSTERLLDVLDSVARVWDRSTAVRTEDADALEATARKLEGKRPLLASATPETADRLADVAGETGAALAITADNLDRLYETANRLAEKGFRDIFLDLRADSLTERIQNNVIIRRGALTADLKPLGYPILSYVDTGDPLEDAALSGLEISKYGGLVVLPQFDPATFAPLLTLRQNIHTDPQKPIQVEPKIYALGEPDEDSPVFVTTNFSLTYFIVSGEIENAGLSAWLLIPECEGMSVLTAWAAGKFGGDKIGAFAKEAGLEKQTKSRKIVIPGYVAQISGELEEAMPDWQVIVGPQEAGDLESFIKNVFAA